VLAYLLLAAAQVVGLAMIPAGYPGVWLQLGAIAAFGWWSDLSTEAGVVPLAILAMVALSADLTNLVVAGSRGDPVACRRLGIFALAGGVLGAVAAHWLPVVGSFFGALGGSLLGAMIGLARGRSTVDGRPRQPKAGPATAFGLAMRVTAGVAAALYTLLEFPGGG